MPDPISAFALMLVKKFVGSAAPGVVRKRMEASIPAIAQGMEAKGMTLANAAPGLVVRDALFRLWRSVIPSGDIADALRDAQEEKVTAAVVSKLDPETDGTETVVRRTLAELINLTF